MKKFKFKLESVLEERKRVEDLRLREWMMSERLLQGLKAQLRGLEGDLGGAIRDGGRLAALPANVSGEFHVMHAFIEGTKIRIQWKTREIERGSKLTEKKRLEYVAARQKREALEKLKARRKQDYADAIRARELKAQDDLYIMRAGFIQSARAGDEEGPA